MNRPRIKSGVTPTVSDKTPDNFRAELSFTPTSFLPPRWGGRIRMDFTMRSRFDKLKTVKGRLCRRYKLRVIATLLITVPKAFRQASRSRVLFGQSPLHPHPTLSRQGRGRQARNNLYYEELTARNDLQPAVDRNTDILWT